MRIIFCGTPEFACPSLQALHDDAVFEIIQVMTQPDRPAGRGKRLRAPPVKILAETLGIPVVQPEDIHKYQVSRMKYQECDFLVLVAYGRILSRDLLAWPRIAPVNVHPSLLPRWRGPSPIQNAILSGDKETGVTIQRMIEKTDAGPILSKERIPIEPRDTKITLEAKLSSLGSQLLVNTLKQPLQESPQDETKASYCKKLTREMGNVDPATMTAEEIDRCVRALVPWPGVRAKVSGFPTSPWLQGAGRFQVSGGENGAAKLIETSLEPHKDALAFSCKGGTTLYIVKLQSPGKNVVTGAAWGRGR